LNPCQANRKSRRRKRDTQAQFLLRQREAGLCPERDAEGDEDVGCGFFLRLRLPWPDPQLSFKCSSAILRHVFGFFDYRQLSAGSFSLRRRQRHRFFYNKKKTALHAWDVRAFGKRLLLPANRAFHFRSGS
jgi:hypothetical protein